MIFPSSTTSYDFCFGIFVVPALIRPFFSQSRQESSLFFIYGFVLYFGVVPFFLFGLAVAVLFVPCYSHISIVRTLKTGITHLLVVLVRMIFSTAVRTSTEYFCVLFTPSLLFDCVVLYKGTPTSFEFFQVSLTIRLHIIQ